MNIIKNASIASASVLVTGVGASMLIPVAMTTFGTVISGIGTIHVAGSRNQFLNFKEFRGIINSYIFRNLDDH